MGNVNIESKLTIDRMQELIFASNFKKYAHYQSIFTKRTTLECIIERKGSIAIAVLLHKENISRRYEMKNTCIDEDFGFFSAHSEDKVLHIKFKKNLLEHLSNIKKRDFVADFMNHLSKSDDIKVVLLNSDFQETGCEAYTRFFFEKSKTRDMFDIHRLCNITSQLVLSIIGLDKIVIHACQGSVISLFLNISLACDYRIAANNTVFCNPYLDIGLIPLGGGPYFLSKMIGTGKTWETLLLNKDFDAQQALKLGLVDHIITSSDFDSNALKIAHKFADNHEGTIKSLKKLINFSKKDIGAYFETEKQEIIKLLNSNDFSKMFKD